MNPFLKIYNRLRLNCIKHEDYFGDYASNLIAKNKFLAINTDAVVVAEEDGALKFSPTIPKGMSISEMQPFIKEQARIHARKLRKVHHLTVYYYNPSIFTWLLGLHSK